MSTFFRHPGGREFGDRCAGLCLAHGLAEVGRPELADVALAPLLTRFLPEPERVAPKLGTLVFHPSALPHGRGPDAIRWAIARGERVSASTWFWAVSGYDDGPVCEQEVVVLATGESPLEAYLRRYVPAGLRALERALDGVRAGHPRRAPQDESLATYDRAFRRGAPSPRVHPAGRCIP
jgi:methionyl-tRNA formyltransferase